MSRLAYFSFQSLQLKAKQSRFYQNFTAKTHDVILENTSTYTAAGIKVLET